MRQGIGTTRNAWAVAIVLFGCHYDIGSGKLREDAGASPETGASRGGASNAGSGGAANGGFSNESGERNGGAGSGGKGTASGGTLDASIDGAPDSTVPTEGGTLTDGAKETGGAGTGGRGTGGTGTGGFGAAGGKAGSGAVSPDAAPPHFCDGQHALLCEDFDEWTSIDDFVNSWGSVSTTGAAFSFDTVGVPSAPHALRIRTTSPSAVTALATRTLPAFVKPPAKLRVEFALRIDAGDAVVGLSGATFAGIMTGTRVADGLIGIEIGPGPKLIAGYVEPGGHFVESAFNTSFPPEGQWLGRYAIEIDYASPGGVRTGCVQIYRGAAAQLTDCLALPSTLVNGSVFSITIGVYGGGAGLTGNVQLGFDDLIVTSQ